MFKKITLVALTSFLMLPIAIPFKSVEANSTANTTSIPFTVQIEKHPLQDSKVNSYFKLNVPNHSGQTLETSVTITNQTEENVEIKTQTLNALTSSTGGIDYNSKTKAENAGFIDESYAIKGAVTNLPKNIYLKPFESKKVNFNITVPNNGVGTYLGGINFLYAKEVEGKVLENQNAVQTRLGRTVAVQLDVSAEPVEPANVYAVYYEMIGSDPYIVVNILNDSKMINYDVSSTYKVRNNKTDEVVFEGKFGPFDMAPSTSINFMTMWQGNFEPGKYSFEVADKTLGFEVKKSEVKKVIEKKELIINEDSVEKGINTWGWILIIITFISGLFFFFFFLKKRKKKKDEEEEKRRRALEEELERERENGLL